MSVHNPPSAVTVLLVDDHAVVREGYRRLLEERGSIAVIGEASDANEAYERFCQLTPQVVVMDISLPGLSGIETMRRMLARAPRTGVLIFSMHEEAIFAHRALQAGALGYVTKASAPHVLVEAVHAIARGKRYLSTQIAQELALRNVNAEAGKLNDLSIREFEVLRFLIEGRSIRAIAEAMNLNPKTIANHQSTIKQKLGVATPVQLLRAAENLGLKPRY
jgi:two-component system, NarL family, invasion response regulator UvrY